jgi:hypothetical protein
LLEVLVRGGLAVYEDRAGRAAIGAAVRADSDADAILEFGVEIPLEEIRRFHDVHIGIDKAQTIFHRNLPW